MADLIVDFPSRARRDASSESSRRATSKSVSFSPEMTIQFYRGPTKAEDDKVRYTSDEYRKFKTDTRSAVRSIHRQYLALAAETGDADAFKGCDLTGLENLLTPELIRKTAARKWAHMCAVIGEQERQADEASEDADRLALVAGTSSGASRKRAMAIGMMQQFK